MWKEAARAPCASIVFEKRNKGLGHETSRSTLRLAQTLNGMHEEMGKQNAGSGR